MASKLNHFFNFLSVIALAMLVMPLTYILLGGAYQHLGFLLPLSGAAAVFLGYFLQLGIARLLRQRLSNDGLDNSRQGIINGFRFSYAILPILLVIGLGVLLKIGADRYLYYLYRTDVIDYYEQPSLYAYLTMAVFLLAAIGGIIVWFYPLERISNIYVILTGALLFLIEFVMTFFVNFQSDLNQSRYHAPMTLVGLCFGVFVACMMLIYNQSNLQKTYQGAVVSGVTAPSRFYNMLLVVILLISLALAGGVAYILVSGLYLLARVIFYLILYKLFYGYVNPEQNYRYEDYVDREETAQRFTRRVMDANSQSMIALFFMMVLALVLLIFCIRKGYLQKLIRFLYSILADFFSTISIGRDLMKGTSLDNYYNYKDVTKKLQRAGSRDYQEMAEQTDSYRSFMQKLGKLSDYEAQISYAYAMLVTLWKRENVNLRIADTPREIKPKVTHLIPREEIDEITREFEAVKYAEQELAPEEASTVLNQICAVVKRYLF